MLLGRLLLKPCSALKKGRIAQFQIGSSASSLSTESYNDEYNEEPYADVPRPCKKWERKPYPTPMKELIRKAKEEKRTRLENPCRVLEHAPENGLLVPDLIEVAHQVHNAKEFMLRGLSKLLDGEPAIPVKKCR